MDDKTKIDLSHLRKWFIKQPQFPQDIDDKLLLRFLHSSHYDIEKAKTVIELFVSIRTASPDLLTDRDPLSTEMQNIMSITNLALLSVSGNKNVWIWQLNDPGLKKYNYVQGVKLFFLQTDAWLLESDFLEEEDVILLDVKDMSLKVLTMLSMSVANRCNKYQQEALPIRLKQIHAVNVSPVFHKIFSVLKPFIKKDVKEKIHFHVPNSETLYEFLDKDMLPQEFGGTNGKMADHTKRIYDDMIRKRKYLKDNLWTSTEQTPSKKEEDVNPSNEVKQSLQALVID